MTAQLKYLQDLINLYRALDNAAITRNMQAAGRLRSEIAVIEDAGWEKYGDAESYREIRLGYSEFCASFDRFDREFKKVLGR